MAVDTSSLKIHRDSAATRSTNTTRSAETTRLASARRSTKPDWFTNRSGHPQLVVSAEDWGLLANGGLNHNGDWKKTYNDYFATRKAQGYNAVEVSLFSFTGLAGGRNGADWDGTEPFTPGTNPRTTPNHQFWARRSYFLSSAARHGFRVFLNVTTPYLHQDPPNTAFTRSWTNTQWRALGTLLGTRYAARRNIMSDGRRRLLRRHRLGPQRLSQGSACRGCPPADLDPVLPGVLEPVRQRASPATRLSTSARASRSRPSGYLTA